MMNLYKIYIKVKGVEGFKSGESADVCNPAKVLD